MVAQNSVNILKTVTVCFKWVNCMVCEFHLNKAVKKQRGKKGSLKKFNSKRDWQNEFKTKFSSYAKSITADN